MNEEREKVSKRNRNLVKPKWAASIQNVLAICTISALCIYLFQQRIASAFERSSAHSHSIFHCFNGKNFYRLVENLFEFFDSNKVYLIFHGNSSEIVFFNSCHWKKSASIWTFISQKSNFWSFESFKSNWIFSSILIFVRAHARMHTLRSISKCAACNGNKKILSAFQ